MLLRVEKIGDGLGVLIPADAMEALDLREGVVVEMKPVHSESSSVGEHRFATVEEGIAAFRQVEPLHRSTFHELAK